MTLLRAGLVTPRLRVSEGVDTPARFTRSAASDGAFMSTSDTLKWLAERCDHGQFTVERIPFDDLQGWSFDWRTGNLGHQSGRFFSVEGLEVRNHPGPVTDWTQPIIIQQEIGILGILMKEFDGVLYGLMQAKMEPGNSNMVQLSPTVQATRSNYTRVHAGKDTPYLQYFRTPRRGRVLVDSLQSEQGGWFMHKRNRNIIIETTEDVEVLPDYCWLTLGQIQQLLCIDNIVNMDARTVLSSIPFEPAENGLLGDGFAESLRCSLNPDNGGLHTVTEVATWLIDNKSDIDLMQRRIPMYEVTGWRRTADLIEHEAGEYFRIIAADIRAGNREVASWKQPLLEPVAPGLLALLTRRVDGVLHVLVQARASAGAMDRIEVAPTVHCMPHSHRDADPALWPRYLDYVMGIDPMRIRYQAWLSEEGGRFMYAKNRYMIIEIDHTFPDYEPPTYHWMTLSQLMRLLRTGNTVNVELRTLIACLQTWIGR
jgi:oxidase EvaA